MERTEVIVVGGGLAGLVAGATAARAGRRVVVLEARSTPGGRARTVEQRGYRFNEGAHALYLEGEALPILRSLGIDPAGGPPPLAGAQGLGADGSLGLLPAGPVELARTPLLGLAAKARTARLLSGLRTLDPEPLAGTTLAAWYEQAVPDPAVRRLVDALVHTSTYANDPEHVSAGAVLRQVQRALGAGVRYLDGGWQVLVDGVRAAAVAAGAEVRTEDKVARVVSTGAGVQVDAGAERWEAPSAVIAVGGPADAAAVLAGTSAAATAWAAAARPARVATLDVALGEPWGDRPKVVLGLDDALYLSVHGDGAALAPPGTTLVSTLRYLRPGEPVRPEEDQRRLEGLLDVARPGWREAAVLTRPGAALVASTDLPTAARGGLAGRPGPEVPDAPGVFVAGDWVGPTGMLADAALASAVAAARAASERSRCLAA